MSLSRIVYPRPDLQTTSLTGVVYISFDRLTTVLARGAWFLFGPIFLPRVSHDIVGEGVNFQFQFLISIVNFQFQFPISIFNFDFQFRFLISIFNSDFQFQFSISIFNSNFQFRFLISICNSNFQFQLSILICTPSIPRSQHRLNRLIRNW